MTLGDFLLSPYEVTVAEFEAFVTRTGYLTSAEGPSDPEAVRAIMERAASGSLSRQELRELQGQILNYSGAGYWDADARRWLGYEPETNWKNPGFEQAPDQWSSSPENVFAYSFATVSYRFSILFKSCPLIIVLIS